MVVTYGNNNTSRSRSSKNNSSNTTIRKTVITMLPHLRFRWTFATPSPTATTVTASSALWPPAKRPP